MSESKKTGTFIVNIMRQDNATWQGELTWADKNQKKNFRSTLELIKMMDEALSDKKKKKKVVEKSGVSCYTL